MNVSVSVRSAKKGQRPDTGCRIQHPAASLLSALLLLAPLAASAEDSHSLVNTKHNLSLSGPGEVRTATETEVCIFCHAPHSTMGVKPLWNHELSAVTYTPYNSSTLKAKVGQPTGASKLCLSCHDGTVALGMVRDHASTTPAPIRMRSGALRMPAGRSRMGTDLSGHHPISFTYDSGLATAQGQLRDPHTLKNQVRLDERQQVQCTSCHDPHNDTYGQFLVEDNTGSALCLECHSPDVWSSSVHATSQATWNGNGINPWPHSRGKTVAANGCENCHATHAAGTKPHLLNFPRAEDNCLVCHRGTVASKNIGAELTKVSSHPIVETSMLHDAAEGALPPSGRHVSCVDCHEPHATRATPAAGDAMSGSLSRVKGVSAGGAPVKNAAKEYELCFRCHSDSNARGNSKITRQWSQPNTRLQFSPGNSSYHPVLSAAKSAPGRSLLSTWSSARQMACTDCHNNDQGPGTKGTGPNGPHGSRYAPLLERNLVQTDFEPESATAYALCYKCHSEGVLMSDRLHSQHVRDQKTACTTCHDAHGVQNQPHLINFNTIYVKPNLGRIDYQDLGSRAACTLTCHGQSHNNTAY